MLNKNKKIFAFFIVSAMIFSGFAIAFSGSVNLRIDSGNAKVASVPQNSQIGQYPDGNNSQGGAYDPYNQELYVTNYFSNNVTVVNAFSGISVANISVGKEPQGITYVPYNHELYVENYGTSNISAISSADNNVVATISLPGSPQFSAYDPQNQALYVSGLQDGVGVIWVLNVTTNGNISTINLPLLNAIPYGLAFDPYNGYIYVTDNYNNYVYVLSPSGTVVDTIDTGQGPYGIALDPVNKMMYVSDNDINSKIYRYPKEFNITIINTNTNSPVKSVVPGSYPEGVAYDPVNGYIYVANSGSANISVLNPTTESIIQSLPARVQTQNGSSAIVYDPVLQQIVSVNDIATIDTTLNYNSAGGFASQFLSSPPSRSVAYDPMNHLLYVGDSSSNAVGVYSLNGELVTSIATAGDIYSVIYGNNTIFAAAYSTSQVVLINPETNTVTNTESLKYSSPDGLAYDSRNNTLFIAFPNNNIVGVMNLSTYKIVKSLGVGEEPAALTYSNITNQVYVGEYDGNIHIINASSYVNIYPNFIGGSYPSQVVYDPYTNSIYIANSGNDSMYIISVPEINYSVSGNTPFYAIPLGSPQQSILLNPSNGLIYIMQSGTHNVTIFNPLLNETVGSINSPALSGAGLMTYIPGAQIILAADSTGVEEISPAQTYNVAVEVGNLVPAGNTWNVQIQPSLDSAMAQVYSSTQLSNQSINLPLPNGTYDLNISTNYGGVHSIHGYFVVNGSAKTLLFYEQFRIYFNETGLPSGTEWSITIGGGKYSSVSNSTELNLSPGTYEAIISGSAGFEPYPSSLLLTVSHANISQGVYFQSPQNQTFGAVSSTIGLYNGGSYAGDSFIPVTPSTFSFYGAYDPALGIMIIPVAGASEAFVQVYNTSENQVLYTNTQPGNFSFTTYDPTAAYFDPSNSMFYVVDSYYNIVASVFPNNLTIENAVHLPGKLTPLISGIGDEIYVANSTGTVFGVNVNTGSVQDFNVNLSLYATVMLPYNKDLFMLNSTGNSLIELNTSTGTVSQYDFTNGFSAFQVIAGPPGTLYISSMNAQFVQVFNESTDKVTASINLVSSLGGKEYSGNIVTGGVYDPFNGYMYFSSAAAPSILTFGNFTIYDPESGKVIGSFPGLNASSSISLILDNANQKIYAVALAGDTLTVISPQTYYSVTVKEKGLPAGTSWTLKLSNGQTFTTTGTSITFSAENDTEYAYILISGNSSFGGTPGSFTLSGGSGTVQASFSLLKYTVDIKETGLPSRTKWFVNISGTIYNSTTNELAVQLPNGTYSYTVNGVSGYTITNATGNIAVKGGATIYVKFRNTSSLPFIDIAIIGGVAAAVAIAAIAVYLARGRKNRK
ncbi:MAG: YncE family protein [Thermoplasmataceae archaeon]